MLDTIGGTRLVPLRCLVSDGGARVFVKIQTGLRGATRLTTQSVIP